MFLEWKQCCECGSLIPAIAKCTRLPDCGFAYRYVKTLDAQTSSRSRRLPVTLDAKKHESDNSAQDTR